MQVNFLTEDQDGRLQVFTGNAGGRGFNLYLKDGESSIEIVDAIGKVQQGAFEEERKAIIQAFNNLYLKF